MGQTDAGVPSGSFDDCPTGTYADTHQPSDPRQKKNVGMHSLALLFCIPNDTNGSTVLDAAPRILKLGLSIYVASGLFRQRFEIDLCM